MAVHLGTWLKYDASARSKPGAMACKCSVPASRTLHAARCPAVSSGVCRHSRGWPGLTTLGRARARAPHRPCRARCRHLPQVLRVARWKLRGHLPKHAARGPVPSRQGRQRHARPHAHGQGAPGPERRQRPRRRRGVRSAAGGISGWISSRCLLRPLDIYCAPSWLPRPSGALIGRPCIRPSPSWCHSLTSGVAAASDPATEHCTGPCLDVSTNRDPIVLLPFRPASLFTHLAHASHDELASGHRPLLQ